MKKLNITLLSIIIVSVLNVFSQDEIDAFRYSQLTPTGTARFSSLAGSMGAFGADFSCLSSNPASIGVYKRSEFTFSPALYYSKATSFYNNTDAYDFKYNFNVGNLGAVFVIPYKKNWYIQFGTGFNRMNNYHNRYIIKGPNTGVRANTTTSMTDYFSLLANGIADSNLTEIGDWAYQTWLIDPYASTKPNQYVSHISGVNLEQRKVIQTTGSANEYVFSSGANYKDMLYIGATVGFPFFSYTQSSTYFERLADPNDTSTKFKSFHVDKTFSSEATGVNFKLGILYQPVKFMRFGFACHTPTFYNTIRERYTSHYETEGYDKKYTSNGKFDYSLTTPLRVIGDLAFIIKKHGFINLHYSFTDYSTMQMHSRYYDFDNENENENIRNYFQAVHTLGIGAEVNLTPVAIRLGYAYNTNPYKSAVLMDGSYHLITGGLGIRTNHFFADFAYMHKLYYNKSVFYNTKNNNLIDHIIVNQHFIFTFGFKI